MPQESDSETAASAQLLAPLARIGAQLEQLNRTLEMLARMLEKQGAARPPFHRPRERKEHGPPWKTRRRHWQPARTEGMPAEARHEGRHERRETGAPPERFEGRHRHKRRRWSE